jgi:hypothetical protein
MGLSKGDVIRMREGELQPTKTSEEKSRLERILGAATGPVKVVADATTDITKAVTDAITECTRVTQTETTKREGIRAHRDVALERIRSAHQLIEKYLHHTYQERLVILKKELEVIDAGLASGNMEVLNMGLGSVTALLQENPLKNVAQITTQIANNEYVLELE